MRRWLTLVLLAGLVACGAGEPEPDFDILIINGTVTGDTNFLNTGIVTLGDQGDAIDVLNFNGGLNTTNNSETRIAALVQTVDTQMDLGAVTLTGDSTVRSGAGALNILSVAGPAQTLTLQSAGATGTVTVANDLTVDTLVTSAGAYDVLLLGGATVTTATAFTNTGIVTLGNDQPVGPEILVNHIPR